MVLGEDVSHKPVYQSTYFALGCNTCATMLASAHTINWDKRTWLKHPILGLPSAHRVPQGSEEAEIKWTNRLPGELWWGNRRDLKTLPLDGSGPCAPKSKCTEEYQPLMQPRLSKLFFHQLQKAPTWPCFSSPYQLDKLKNRKVSGWCDRLVPIQWFSSSNVSVLYHLRGKREL